jgi:hypothetical protein
MRKWLRIGTLITNFLLIGCTTVKYVKTELPVYEVEEVERPQITETSDDVIKLIEYAKIKEIQLNTFVKFYNQLREGK